jgi:hypothetical protein
MYTDYLYSLPLQVTGQDLAYPDDGGDYLRVEGRVRNNPTQAKRRLEWATQSFVARVEGPAAGKLSAPYEQRAARCSAAFNLQSEGTTKESRC